MLRDHNALLFTAKRVWRVKVDDMNRRMTGITKLPTEKVREDTTGFVRTVTEEEGENYSKQAEIAPNEPVGGMHD